MVKSQVSAYLEEVCYWATINFFQQLPSMRSFSRVECFSVARETAANPKRLFKNYNYQLSRVKTYAQSAIRRAILEEIRGGSELQRYSPTALLRSVGKRTVREALQKANSRETEVNKYLLAYECFREIYVPTGTVEAASRNNSVVKPQSLHKGR